MISAAAQADLAILIISARRGEFETGFLKDGQTREHAMLVKTVGVLNCTLSLSFVILVFIIRCLIINVSSTFINTQEISFLLSLVITMFQKRWQHSCILEYEIC